MKKLFLIVAAMFAAVSFSACSDDDDNGGKAPTPEKWVKQIVFRAEWDESWTSTITYDSENRVKKINGLRNDSYEFTYNGNSYPECQSQYWLRLNISHRAQTT